MFTVNIKDLIGSASGLCDNRSTTTGQQVSAKPRVCLQMLIINLSENITDAQTLIIMSVGTFQNNLKSFIQREKFNEELRGLIWFKDVSAVNVRAGMGTVY